MRNQITWINQTDGGAISMAPVPLRFIVTGDAKGYTLVDRKLIVEWSQISTLKEAQQIAEDLVNARTEEENEARQSG